jgi:hypothetical protein
MGKNAQTLDPEGNELKYGAAMRGADRHHWERAADEEWDRLITETGTLTFVPSVPTGEKATYYNPQLKVKHNPDPIYRVRGAVGGDRVTYDGETAAQTAAMSTVKILFNAIASEKAKALCLEIKDFYLGTPMAKPVYVNILLRQISITAQKKHGIYDPAADQDRDSVYARADKTIYGLPQAGLLSQQRLVGHLADHGYLPCEHTPCLFRHRTRDVTFALVVDDFAVKYQREEDAEHFLATLRILYQIKVDHAFKKFVGFAITYDPIASTCGISMPGYVEQALRRFKVTKKTASTNSPVTYTPPVYGRAQQQFAAVDESRILPSAEITYVQQVVGVFLYYARAVDPIMLCAISKIGSNQARPTERFLQYAATFPVTRIVYSASDMVLHVHSDASYLSESKARSRAGGYFFLGTHNDPFPTDQTINGGIEVLSTIIPAVCASAAEAEYATLFLTGQTAAGLRNTLADFGYTQPPTAIVTDNTCAVGISNNTIKIKRTKAMDMRWHWIRDRVRQGQFSVIWRAGKENRADYFTKAHPVKHHLEQRRIYVR